MQSQETNSLVSPQSASPQSEEEFAKDHVDPVTVLPLESSAIEDDKQNRADEKIEKLASPSTAVIEVEATTTDTEMLNGEGFDMVLDYGGDEIAELNINTPSQEQNIFSNVNNKMMNAAISLVEGDETTFSFRRSDNNDMDQYSKIRHLIDEDDMIMDLLNCARVIGLDIRGSFYICIISNRFISIH